MTNEEFDAILLPSKLTFPESEGARQVLVLGLSVETAAYCVGWDGKEGVAIVKRVIELIKSSI